MLTENPFLGQEDWEGGNDAPPEEAPEDPEENKELEETDDEEDIEDELE